MSDRFELLVRYNDRNGDDLFARLPGYCNNVITIALYGRDTRPTGGGDFLQKVFWSAVPPNQPAGSGASSANVINTFGVSPNGRPTAKKVWNFYLKFTR